MKKFKDWTQNTKLFAVLIIVLLIGIIVRWPYIKDRVKAGFGYFNHSEETQ